MAYETVWMVAEVFSAIILLAALVLMAKFYEEYLEAGIQEMNDWKLITIGFAFYVALKTHFTVIASLANLNITAFPAVINGLYYFALITASTLVFLGFYGLVKDYM